MQFGTPMYVLNDSVKLKILHTFIAYTHNVYTKIQDTDRFIKFSLSRHITIQNSAEIKTNKKKKCFSNLIG